MAGIGLFGSGVMMGNGGSCGLAGIFGSCQNYGRQNAENIDRLNEYASALTDYVLEIENESNEKFFLISNEIAEVRRIQQEMSDNQNKNWKIIQQQFDIFESNFHVLRDCTQMLFSNQQLNFNFDTIASLLSILYSDIKSYRSALYAYNINMLNSIPILLNRRLPMSLVPRDSLLAILNSVYEAQKTAPDRLTLAVPITDLLSYYDANLLREVSTVQQGLLLTLAIPLASRQTSFTIYSAHVVPMPQQTPSEAIQWVIEAPYLAVSEDSMETSVLTQYQLDQCLGSSRYRICHETLETHLGQSSCLATLFFHSSIAALQVCDTQKVLLPTPERATNLGYGIWLLTSASSSYTLREHRTGTSMASTLREFPGCNICLMTLECGSQLISKNIKIRPDLESCAVIKAHRIDVQLPDPLKHLISYIPNLDELPYFESTTDAGISLLRQVKTDLIESPPITGSEQLSVIAEPIAAKMQQLKPTLVNKLDSYVPIKLSLTLTITVFFGNLFLHILAMYLYHRFAIFKRLTQKFLRFEDSKISVKPVVSVPAAQKQILMANPSKWTNNVMILTDRELEDIQRSRSSLRRSRSMILTSTQDNADTTSIYDETQLDTTL